MSREDVKDDKNYQTPKLLRFVSFLTRSNKPCNQILNACNREPASEDFTSCIIISLVIDYEERKETVFKLLENKLPNDSIIKTAPRSLQMEDLKKVSGILSKNNTPSQIDAIAKDWEKVFYNRISLALSFRKGNTEFLQSSADFDYPALDLLINLCKKFEALGRQVNKAVVQNIINY